MKKLYELINKKILIHFRVEKVAPHQLALGTSIGLFHALNPWMGIQTYLTIINWYIFRKIKIDFSLPVAIAMVWITNPVTMPLFYYTFYITGYGILNFMGEAQEIVSYENIKLVLAQSQTMDLFFKIRYWGEFMIYSLGWPMLLGSIIINIPITITAYPVTIYLIHRARKKKQTKTDNFLTLS